MQQYLFQFVEKSQSHLNVTLKGEAYTYQSSKQGVYIVQTNTVNGKTHWNIENGKFALWYVAKGTLAWSKWIIGEKRNVGTSSGSIASPDDVAHPQEVTTWKYFDGKNWLSHPGDVTITCITNSKNFISIMMKII